MKYAVEMGSGAMIFPRSSLNIGSGIQTLMCVCGGEGQLVSECRLESPPVERQVTSNSQTPPLVEEEAPISKHVKP
jgi:hypothetical protein